MRAYRDMLSPFVAVFTTLEATHPVCLRHCCSIPVFSRDGRNERTKNGQRYMDGDHYCSRLLITANCHQEKIP